MPQNVGAPGCGCYAFELRIDGTIHRACGLGEVHTLAEFRGRGFAPQLIAWVEERQRLLGGSVSLLYSDISAAYYERLGYRTCASFEGWTESREHRPETTTAGDALARFDPLREIDALAPLHDGYHAGLAMSVSRSRSYWDYLLARDPEDEFLWLVGSAGERLAYVRLASTADALKIRDVALIEHGELLLGRLFSAVVRHGVGRGVRRVGGWMPPTSACRALFTLCERKHEITMVKPLVAELMLQRCHLKAAAHLHEVDHV